MSVDILPGLKTEDSRIRPCNYGRLPILFAGQGLALSSPFYGVRTTICMIAEDLPIRLGTL